MDYSARTYYENNENRGLQPLNISQELIDAVRKQVCKECDACTDFNKRYEHCQFSLPIRETEQCKWHRREVEQQRLAAAKSRVEKLQLNLFE